MGKSLKILFIPIDAVGHVNACIGIAQVLKERGHRIAFAIFKSWSGRLVKYGFEEELLTQKDRDPDEDPAKYWADLFVNGGAIQSFTPLEKAINISTKMFPFFIEESKSLDLTTSKLINRVQPDVIILDQALCIPSVVKSGIPWVSSCSFNPLMFIDDERTPPASSGLPAVGPVEDWINFRNAVNEARYEAWKSFNEYAISRGILHLAEHSFKSDSPYLNIYGLPLEIDYIDMRPLPPKWYRFDNLKRTEILNDFVLPESLRNKFGKLIYFSMGSMGGADIGLMKRLVSILSKSPHKFIVSKGPLHNRIELSDNMWGQQSVPQLQVLQIVDLVITHGGNNSVSEIFYFGKPMIVMPLFADQYDNAQRIHEKGFGIRLEPYSCSEHELLEGIEKLLSDKSLAEKMKSISKRIQSDNSISKLPQLIEGLCKG